MAGIGLGIGQQESSASAFTADKTFGRSMGQVGANSTVKMRAVKLRIENVGAHDSENVL